MRKKYMRGKAATVSRYKRCSCGSYETRTEALTLGIYRKYAIVICINCGKETKKVIK